ncbi:alanine dehydrogenase [Paenibacillus allorhizosphaerae]|uniref:Alanine dehydrogenase n=1 Tax=Paenibacillus allorhizosphaerae TaxID=2849866 RepID=A0ABM8VBD3_9BACL|nr:alanine dehydrogenase [Paenibacillus allorhizosphaerae]CAG7618550.1 Alanine dehydrogenase [Paenibacillus allorhizosphaerae]
MRIGLPKEIKNNEYRVALTPAGAAAFVRSGHEVWVEQGAGAGSSFPDNQYAAAGAKLVEKAADVWASADMIMKVKEPLPSEYAYFRKGLVLFTYLHLAAEPALARALTDKQVTAIAYETVEWNRTLPLLVPMSEIAGRMSAQIGAQFLEKSRGGKGLLLGGVPGVSRGKITIIGGGVVGINAAKIALGLGADVSIIDVNPERLRYLDDIFGSSIQTLMSNSSQIAEAVAGSDLVIGAVLIPGAKAPKLVTADMIQAMSPGSVIVDVAVDQGGIFETVDRITTHDDPVFVKHGVLHYAVANMPGAVPRTSTLALTNATLPYGLEIAGRGVTEAIRSNAALRTGVNVMGGTITHATVAKDLGYVFVPVDQAG